MAMRETRISLPELALIAGTRGALGAGLGLLLANRLPDEERRAAVSRVPPMSACLPRIARLLAFAAGFALPTPAVGQAPAVTIRASRVLDGRGKASDDVLVTVENGRITRVERAGANVRAT